MWERAPDFELEDGRVLGSAAPEKIDGRTKAARAGKVMKLGEAVTGLIRQEEEKGAGAELRKLGAKRGAERRAAWRKEALERFKAEQPKEDSGDPHRLLKTPPGTEGD